MKTGAYYNEHDPYAAQWLRNLIDAGHIAPGVVDERDIQDVQAKDFDGFTQCHFFAGLGGWSHALRLAGWPDSRPVWTGSPPCQPFSVAGKQLGKRDERHLAPHWLALVSECRPDIVFGEQVESAIRHGWLDDLQVHLEAESYACGPVVLPACSVGAPQLRRRLWIVAERLADAERDGGRPDESRREAQRGTADRGNSATDELAHAPSERRGEARHTLDGPKARESGHGSTDRPVNSQHPRLEGLAGHGDGIDQPGRQQTDASGSAAEAGESGIVGETKERNSRPGLCQDNPISNGAIPTDSGSYDRPGPTNGFWRAADWLYCRDDKWRAVEPGTFPLANGISARVGKLRAYGNAIVPSLAAEVISAYMEYTP